MYNCGTSSIKHCVRRKWPSPEHHPVLVVSVFLAGHAARKILPHHGFDYSLSVSGEYIPSSAACHLVPILLDQFGHNYEI